VGTWRIPTNGAMELTYDEAWVASEHARPVSLSLPLNFDGQPLKGERVGFFFDNLLPDSESIRRRIRNRFRTQSGDAFDLLAAIGRDCVGALQLLPEGAEPSGLHKIEVESLDDERIEQLLRAAGSDGLTALGDVDDDFRISIAGAQEKTALTWHEGQWCKPHGATPTTHIFKLPLGLVGGRQLDLRTSLENEWLCARMLAAFDVPVVASELKVFGSMKVLVVTRFDRALHSSGRYWLRLPQEDFCQATGTPPTRKYESDGGPGVLEISRILSGSEARDTDLETLMRAQLLFWMLAAIDGHAKNFSIRLLSQGRFRLTPLYDVISAWPLAGARHNQIHPKKLKLAMALRGATKHYQIDAIRRRHFDETARACGLGADMDGIIEEVVARTPGVIAKLGATLPKGFPGSVFERVTQRLTMSRDALARTATRV